MSVLKTTYDSSLHRSEMNGAPSSVSGWVAAIADRVKNPVAGVRAASEIIQRELIAFHNGSELDVQKALEASQMMHKTLGHLSAYLDELSLFAKPFELHLSAFSLHQLIQSSIEISRKNFRDRSMIGAVVQPGISQITGDFPRLCRALSAIISNALESVPTDLTPRVLIQAECSNNEVIISVEDNGSGIAPEYLPRIFEPFFSTKEAGTGLGLAIASKYIEAHHGQIKISANHDSDGTVVCVRIPIQKATAT